MSPPFHFWTHLSPFHPLHCMVGPCRREHRVRMSGDKTFRHCGLAFMIWTAACVTPLPAQDLRVYTSVTELAQAPEQQRVISHSLTLFHAGRVYNYIDQVGEVVIFEPAHHRFIILGNDFTATEVPFSELNHFLETARKEAAQYIGELEARNNPDSDKLAAALRFQLNPEFLKSSHENAKRLSLQGSSLTYHVETAEAESPELVRQYLNYADWAARLNYVLHPHSAYPAGRLQLNAELRERGRLPTRVELTMHLQQTVRLRAAHQYDWKLQSVDRKHISHWERTLQSNRVRWMTFHEYQQHLVAQRPR